MYRIVFLLCFFHSQAKLGAQITVTNQKGTRLSLDTSKWSVSGTNISNKNSGNVGIGTSVPSAKLTIANNKNGTVPALRIDTLLSGNSSDSIVVWRRSDSSLRKMFLTIADTNIYRTDGTISSNRNVYLNNSNTFRINTGTSVSPGNSILHIDPTRSFIGIGLTTAGPPSSATGCIDTFSVQGTVNAVNYTSPVQTLSYAATLNWDLSKGANAKVTLTGNVTSFNLINLKPGMYGLIVVTQDATGSRTMTFGSGTNRVINGGGGIISLTSAGNSNDILSFFFDGTILWWTIGNNYN